MGAEDIVKVFLLWAVILAFSGNSQTEKIAVKLQASVRVRNSNRRVVDAQKKAVSRAMPLGIPPALRKPEDFHRMLIRVLKVEGSDAAGIFVPVGQPLRA